MKWMSSLPIVLVAIVGVVALTLDDRPDYETAPRAPKRGLIVPAKSIAVENSLSANETLLVSETLEFPREAPKEIPVEAPKGKPALAGKPAPAGKKAPTPKSSAPDIVVRKVEVPRSRVDVEARRLHPDERLQQAVMAAITRLPNLSGQIAVEAKDAVVRLSGWTTTPGQSRRAQNAAARVDGVRQVVNEIRPRMGAITS